MAMPSDNTPLQPETPFLGLAPFLRMSIAGQDLQPVGQQLLAKAAADENDANLWMNLSLALFCLGQRNLGLAIQGRALAMKREYHLVAAEQPAKVRLLMLMVAGDLSANTPIECLLENSDIDLVFYYFSLDAPVTLPFPEHDVLMVAISEAEENYPLLTSLKQKLTDWPKPVINAPQNIPRTGRELASALLQNVPGLLMPATLSAPRVVLQAIATGFASLSELFETGDFPLILRPVGSHAGRDLDKIDGPDALADYLSRVDAADFYLSPFIDYSGADGLFRKMRVALINDVPFACHMGVSEHWMIHYVNAGMYEEAWKRAEEAAFMTHFDDFAQRHQAAFQAIVEQTQLDYLCIDCAETPDGQLLVFEIDHAMVVHAMDSETQFPYKQAHMKQAKDAFRNFLFRITAA